MAPRTPLAPLDINRSFRKEFTPFQRGQISAFKASGRTITEIAQCMSCAPAVIHYNLAKEPQRDQGKDLPRSGRPQALNRTQKRNILRVIRTNPKITYRALAAEVGVECHRKTLYRFLTNYGFMNWRAAKRPYLTAEHAALRLAWCLERKDWSYEDWSKIIFSDECSLERGAGRARTWVFRQPHQRWDRDKIDTYKKGKDISVMIWGAIKVGDRSDIEIMTRDPDSARNGYTANSYIKVLENQLETVYEPGLSFMQDNARIHTAQKVKDWFTNNAIVLLEWPPYSPDLNPIEHLWAKLKEFIHEKHPELMSMGKSDADREALERAIYEAWDAIGQGVIDNLIKSMDTRVNSVIAARGWYTRF